MSLSHFFGKYTESHKDPDKPNKIKRLYNNYEACKHCSARNKCCSSSQTHRIITEYGSEMQKAMDCKWKNKNIKMNTQKDQALKDHLEY